MDKKALEKVTHQIHRKYPEFSGCQPKVRRQRTSQTHTNTSEPTYLLTFKTSAQVASSSGEKTISRSLRVVANDNGKIIKVSTSR